ncbi:hypothetical protein [Leifsonia aquatica]|jgi:hypothetical protein|uniref:Uncharacterized protein n=2 Tax=Leifsonia aquatica TaxID=144185 RepID=A0A7W4UZY5_LEIAQ|nr:hypothetical protein [Leifsonia aquatica]MBB2969349.1 hypothetical protein [Leifsonia aquatica]
MSGTLATDGPAPDAGSTAALSALILEVAGVATLYPAASPAGQVVAAIGSALTAGPADPGTVLVSGDRIRVRIGVDGVDAAGEVCRRVYDVVRDWAASTGRAGAVIDVTAATIGG